MKQEQLEELEAITFQDPEPVINGRPRVEQQWAEFWERVAVMLKENPDKWALVRRSASPTIRARLRAGLVKGIDPDYFDIKCQRVDPNTPSQKRVRVYMRYCPDGVFGDD